MIKIQAIISFMFFFFNSASAQFELNDIEDKAILKRILHIKSMTDPLVLSKFDKKTQQKFYLDFTFCSYRSGERGSDYLSLNKDKPEVDRLNNVVHTYLIMDESIHLWVMVSIFFWQYNTITVRYNSPLDSLYMAALDRIYDKGVLQKIKQKTKEMKIKEFDRDVEVDEKSKTFFIILKDKRHPKRKYYFV